jgi:hypothetical protein
MRRTDSVETTQELTDEELFVVSGGRKIEVSIVMGNFAMYVWATKDDHGGYAVTLK